jgi:hypothetical protein
MLPKISLFKWLSVMGEALKRIKIFIDTLFLIISYCPLLTIIESNSFNKGN